MAKDNKIHTVYKLEDGTRVPSVTTIIGILDKPAIVHWAWQQGVAGLDYRKVRDESALTGTLVHYLALCKLKGEEPDLSDYSPNEITAAQASVDKLEVWLGQHKIEPILLETPLVSETYKFGGTMDFYGKIDGRLAMRDFKTGKDVYIESYYQLAAYNTLIMENGYEPAESLGVILLSKDPADDLYERIVKQPNECFDIFLACHQIYELQKIVRKGR